MSLMYGSLIFSGKRYTLAIASQLQTKEPKHRGHKRRQQATHICAQSRCSFCCRCLCSNCICSTLTRQNSKIYDVFGAIFEMFYPQFKKQTFLAPFLPPLIRTQEGVKFARYCQTTPKVDILFVTIFATKFWLKKLGEAVWAQKML